MKINTLKYSIGIICLMVLVGCSTKKNTALSRGFHNLTSRYNILFNGWESYDKGIDKLESSYEDDYSKQLPIFTYHDKDQLSGITSDMDRSILKATKVISLHSITAKPELNDDRELSEKEREFYNKSEYNKWVDYAYLLLGKASFYKHEFDKASETFRYIVTNFPEGEVQIEARIWLARLSLEKNKIKEVESILESLDEEEEMPKKLQVELESTDADKEIVKGNTSLAIEHLEKAVELTRNKYYKQRYGFILAQLYQKQKNAVKAAESYKAVIKLNPPYEMIFNAQINMALSYETGAVSRKEVEKQLQKMLRDDKNIDYQDQIYYAWGNLYYQEGNIDKALAYYKLSASNTKGNKFQLARTYLTIADIYYSQPNYISAQLYYDSTVSVIDMGYPNYNVIYAKSISLTNLVSNIETVALEDSVQKLAYLSEEQLNEHIDKIIENERIREEELKEQELARKEIESLGTQQKFEIQTNKNSWYFYNATAINLGRQEFRKKWGARKLEDNWRRLNKKSIDVGFDVSEELSDARYDNGAAAKIAKQKLDKYTRPYYLIDIPFTDSAKEQSHARIKYSLNEIGDIYNDELNDLNKAKVAYEELLSRYPSYEDRLHLYYKLYIIGKKTENISMVSKYQQKIVNEFPNSNYALILGDPNYFKKVEEQERKIEQLYIQTYTSFEKGNHRQTLALIDKAMKISPDNSSLREYDYMKTISAGLMKDTATFINDLEKFISRYPNSELSERSRLIIKYLKTENPEAGHEQEVKYAASVFDRSPNQTHYVVVTIPKNNDVNQLMFNIISFNIDNYPEEDFKVKKEDINSTALLNVTSFENQEKAIEYYTKLMNHKGLFRDLNPADSRLFVISESNSRILRRDKNIDQYQTFFSEILKQSRGK